MAGAVATLCGTVSGERFMNGYWLSFGIAFCTALALTRLARSLATRLRALDRPDGWRKLHKRPVPLWGGVGVFGAMLSGIAFVAWDGGIADPRFTALATVLALSASLIFVLGFVDDSVDLPGRVKLLLQVLCVVPVVVAGFGCEHVGLLGHEFHLGYWGIPLTVLWLVGCINAMNLLDGMDGNASVVGLVACGAVAVIAVRHGQSHVAALAIPLAAALAGFLVYNRPAASIYLGDSGSTVIGMALGLLCLQGGVTSTGALRISVPLVVMTLPLLDTSLAIVRRKLTGQRFDCADRGHIHHRLLDQGFTTWQALCVVTVLCLLTSTAAAVAAIIDFEPLAWLASLTLVVSLVRFRWFGHYELSLVKLSMAGALASVVNRLMAPTRKSRRSMLRNLPNLSFENAWLALTNEMRRWHGQRVELRIYRDDRPRATPTWTNPAPTVPLGYEWRMAMTFGPRRGVRCELQVVGQDAETSEPWYLNRVAIVLKMFGRFWLAHPERVPELGPQPATLPRDPTAPATIPLRDAA